MNRITIDFVLLMSLLPAGASGGGFTSPGRCRRGMNPRRWSAMRRGFVSKGRIDTWAG